MDTSASKNSTTTLAALPVTNYLRFSGPALRQEWALPESIIFYMAKNPSTPRFYGKIIRSCKYFFLTNPVIICSELTKEEETDDNGAAAKDNDIWEIVQNFTVVKICYGKRYKNYDMKKCFAKLWAVSSYRSKGAKVHTFEGLSVHMQYIECILQLIIDRNVKNRNIVSSIIPKFYRCDVKSLQLSNQDITFNELLFLTSSASNILLIKVTVKDGDGAIVPVEKIVENVPKLKNFHVELNDNDTSISSETFKNLLRIRHFIRLESFTAYNLPESFDVDAIYRYYKEYTWKNFYLLYSQNVSAAYKEKVVAAIERTIEEGTYYHFSVGWMRPA